MEALVKSELTVCIYLFVTEVKGLNGSLALPPWQWFDAASCCAEN